MATTSELHGDDTWAWPCPYCGASNGVDAAACAGCGVQLRDPEEDDLFTTTATENAQVIDPSAPRIRESLWSTDAALVQEGVVDAEPLDAEGPPAAPTVHVGPATTGPITGPGAGSPSAAGWGGPVPPAPGGPPPANGAPSATTGPFSASATRHVEAEPPPGTSSVFGAQSARHGAEAGAELGRNPFGVPPVGNEAPPAAAAAHPMPPAPAPPAAAPPPNPVGVASPGAADPFAPSGATGHLRATPDPHGLSVAVGALPVADQERCAVPIGVCGALLADNEVVLGAVTGHLLGHAAVVVLTNARVLVANGRRWTPLVDEFRPTPDLVVHTRHDRDVASITFVQGQSLTGVDDITDVAAALDLAERIRAQAAAAAT